MENFLVIAAHVIASSRKNKIKDKLEPNFIIPLLGLLILRFSDTLSLFMCPFIILIVEPRWLHHWSMISTSVGWHFQGSRRQILLIRIHHRIIAIGCLDSSPSTMPVLVARARLFMTASCESWNSVCCHTMDPRVWFSGEKVKEDQLQLNN